MLTYAALAERLNASAEAARADPEADTGGRRLLARRLGGGAGDRHLRIPAQHGHLSDQAPVNKVLVVAVRVMIRGADDAIPRCRQFQQDAPADRGAGARV